MFKQIPDKIVQTNKLPFFIGIGILLLVIAVFMYKAQMNQKIEITQSKPHQSLDVSPNSVAASWFNDERFQNIKFNKSLYQPTLREIAQRLISSRANDARKQEMEDEYATQLEIQKMEDKNKIEEKKLELEALQAPLGIEVPAAPGAQAANKIPSAKDYFTNELSQIMGMTKSTAADKITALASLGGQLITDMNNQEGKQAFLSRPQEDDDYLHNTKKKPHSMYEIKAGSYIPAALITGINSDLPGNVNAQVIQNVYDTVTGNYLLIPQGARLIGEYNSSLTFGQKRVQIVWNRIIFPDGQSIDLEKMQGVDEAGYTGFYDKVDNHYLRIYGNAVLLSLMGAGYDILNQKAEQDTDPRQTVAASVGQKLADVGGQTLEKNMDVQPTLIIDPGYRFNIMVMKDMDLEKLDDAQRALTYST